MDESLAAASKRTHGGDQGGETKRRAPDGARRASKGLDIIEPTRPHEKDQSYEAGERVKLSANFFRLPQLPNWCIYKYHTTFKPECLMARFKNAMIAQHKEKIGGFLFDGVQLFVTRELPEEKLVLESRTREDTVYQITLKFTKAVPPNTRDYLQICNLILRRATASLDWKLVNRHYYDPGAKIDLRQFNIQLWPGFQTSIRMYRQDILVSCDVIHKVMRTDTVYDLMQELLRTNKDDFQKVFKQKVLGMTVLTEYNNTTYRIDDVDFDINPMTTFKKRDKDVTIRDYYSEKYQIRIQDTAQPLLITKPKEKTMRGGQDKPTWLVPELCKVTGLSERQRTDISLKNAMKPYSQMVPRMRRQRILAFNNRVQSTPKSISVIKEWNLGLDRDMVTIDGYRINPEILRFGNKREVQAMNGAWERECGRNTKVFQEAKLARWYLIYPAPLESTIDKFIRRFTEISRNMDFEVKPPRKVNVSHDRDLAKKVSELISHNPQMIFFAVAGNKNSNSDTYSAIKKACFADFSVASQVATKYILTREKGYDSAVTKIALQMCSKLGGAPWSVKIPMGGVMTIGFDVSKDSKNKGTSFGCLVATMDLRERSDFYATVTSYNNTETLAKEFTIGVLKAIEAWKEKHVTLPKKIIIYRGGVGDGDLPYLRDTEVKQIDDSLKELYRENDVELNLAYIVVTKRVNTRIFEGENNPKPGTVVDNIITLKERYEFFLVSVFSNQGSVSPTNYNIIHDSFSDWQIDRFQKWTYKHTHLYYNWTGTIKVPAPLQYATKLCFMVSNYIHQKPKCGVENSLYFL